MKKFDLGHQRRNPSRRHCGPRPGPGARVGARAKAGKFSDPPARSRRAGGPAAVPPSRHRHASPAGRAAPAGLPVNISRRVKKRRSERLFFTSGEKFTRCEKFTGKPVAGGARGKPAPPQPGRPARGRRPGKRDPGRAGREHRRAGCGGPALSPSATSLDGKRRILINRPLGQGLGRRRRAGSRAEIRGGAGGRHAPVLDDACARPVADEGMLWPGGGDARAYQRPNGRTALTATAANNSVR